MKESKTQSFINSFIKSTDCFEGILNIIEESKFNKITKNIKPKMAYMSTFLNDYDIDNMLHPLQKIYEIEDYNYSYPNGAMCFGYQMAFKYKGVFYEFESYGGN